MSISKVQRTLIGIFFLQLFSMTLTAQQVKPTEATERLKSLAAKRTLAGQSPFSTSFRNIGPTVQGGRVVELAVNPDDPTEFYAAYATGGLWHTTNNGQSFTPVFDHEDVIFLGTVAVHWPTRTIWVGTGEANSSRSTYSGLGVYKSTNNGKSWEYLGLPESHHIGALKLHPSNPDIAWVAATGHLYSPNKERGVYKTNDGGKTWKQTLFVDNNTGAIDLDINPQNPNEVYATMWFKTRKAWNLEEGGKTSGIYKSTDGGEKWTLITGQGSGFPNGDGVGRIGVAVFPNNPDIVYAIVDNQSRQPDTATQKKDTLTYEKDALKGLTKEQFAQLNNNRLDTFLRRNRLPAKYTAANIKERVAKNELKPTALFDYLYDANDDLFNTPIIGAEIYRSDNGGKSWKKTNIKNMPRLYNTYGYYFGRISVSPTNPDRVVVMGVGVELSTDGGKTFSDMDARNVHADHHACWINPKRDNHMIIGNDGGVNITYDDGKNWFKVSNVPVGQFYTVTTDNARPFHVYGGLQDNGVWRGSTARQRTSDASYDTLQYRMINGGDGMGVQVDLRDNKTVYSGSQFGNYARTHLDTGGMMRIRPQHELGEEAYRFNWLTPILLSRHNQDILYMGSSQFHRSMNKGANMVTLSPDLTNGKVEGDVPFGTIATISESPMKFGLLYTGTDDGNMHISQDAGATWTQIGKTLTQVKGLWVSRVHASKFKEGRVYATFNGYRNDHFSPYIFVSEDYGNTWKSISANLPLEPVNVIHEDPKKEQVLYAGTDGGLYVSHDAGKSWKVWNKGLPFSIPVHDIAIQERDNQIVLATHGRSLFVAALKEVQEKE
jgi:photosystem II stability/assembly factor-like uncharacterized protein